MLASLFKPRADEERALQVTPWGPWTGGSNGIYDNYGAVGPETSMQLLTVYGCVTLISDTIATLPRDVFRTQSDGTNVELAGPGWLERPNATTDIVEFLTQTLASLLLEGNAYWAYGLDRSFITNELHVLDPCEVDVRPDQAGNVVYYVRGQEYRGRLLHIKGLTRPGQLKGLSPVESARQALSLGLNAQEFAGNFFKNGTVVSGVIEAPGDMTIEQVRKLRDGFQRDHSRARAHTAGVLTNGAQWKPMTVTPEQAQFLQTREFQSAEICSSMFLLDPSMLGLSVGRGQNLTYANLEQRGIHLVQFTLLRWIVRLERAISSLLPRPQYFKFNVNGLMRADLKTRYEAYRIGLGPNVPFLLQNEPRAWEDLPAVPGGNVMPDLEPITPDPPPDADETQQNSAPIVNVTIPPIRVPPIVVNIEGHTIQVEPTPVDVHNHVEPVFNVPTPEVHNNVQPTPIVVEGTIVHNNIEPTPVTVENRIDVQPTPVETNVAAPQVTVEAPVVHIQPPDVNVDVAPPEVNVAAPQVTVEAPEVTVQPADVRVEAPIVNVKPPDVNVEAPVVNVRPPSIRVDAPQIHMPKQGKIRRTFERDDKDAIVAVIEEPIEDDHESD